MAPDINEHSHKLANEAVPSAMYDKCIHPVNWLVNWTKNAEHPTSLVLVPWKRHSLLSAWQLVIGRASNWRNQIKRQVWKSVYGSSFLTGGELDHENPSQSIRPGLQVFIYQLFHPLEESFPTTVSIVRRIHRKNKVSQELQWQDLFLSTLVD